MGINTDSQNLVRSMKEPVESKGFVAEKPTSHQQNAAWMRRVSEMSNDIIACNAMGKTRVTPKAVHYDAGLNPQLLMIAITRG